MSCSLSVKEKKNPQVCSLTWFKGELYAFFKMKPENVVSLFYTFADYFSLVIALQWTKLFNLMQFIKMFMKFDCFSDNAVSLCFLFCYFLSDNPGSSLRLRFLSIAATNSVKKLVSWRKNSSQSSNEKRRGCSQRRTAQVTHLQEFVDQSWTTTK